MTLKLVSWRADQILAKTPKALKAVGAAMAEEAKTQITEVQYDWPNPTLRFTSLLMGGTPGGSGTNLGRKFEPFSPPTTAAGAKNTRQFKGRVQSNRSFGRGIRIPEGPRDIVDTGTLLRSQTAPKVTGTATGAELSIKWTAPYSGVVLRGGDYGEYVNPQGRIVDVGEKPGRDWITPTLRNVPAAAIFANAWRGGGQ
jgi:hypothetical protein